MRKNDQAELLTHFDFDIIQDRNVTVARLVMPPDYPVQPAIGSARRAPGDPHQPGIGITLALSRAFRELADQYQEAADEAVAINCGQKQDAPNPGTQETPQTEDRFTEAFRK